MAAYITDTELASYLQTTIAPGSADLVVELTNGLVTDVVGDLVDPPTRVRTIALEVAARAWRNPQAFSSVTVGIDDYDKTVRREGAALAAPGVYLTESEEAELRGFLGVQRSRVGSIRLQVPDAY
jgi:hypothetical protein